MAQPQAWLSEALSLGGTSATGASVNEKTALGHAPVYSAVRVIADSVAQLPIKVYRNRERGRDADPSHPLWSVLHDLANPYMTASEFKACMQGHLCLWGNAYAEVEKNALGQVVGLWPLRPDCMTVTANEQGQRVWLYQVPAGGEARFVWANPKNTVAPILHLRGLMADPFTGLGLSPLTLLREPIGLSMAAEEYGARLFSNSARPSGVLQSPGTLTPDAAKRLKESWDASFRGLGNAHRVAVLEQGITWNQIGMSAEDAQFLQTRKFQLAEIARIFRVPPHMLGDLDRATFSNIEHQAIEFVTHTLTPWLVAWEQAIARDLFSVKGFASHSVRFVVAGLLRGDIQTRYAAYATGRQWGWLSANDVRELEDMNPLPNAEGDIYLSPSNMMAADQVDEEPPTVEPQAMPQTAEPDPVQPDDEAA